MTCLTELKRCVGFQTVSARQFQTNRYPSGPIPPRHGLFSVISLIRTGDEPIRVGQFWIGVFVDVCRRVSFDESYDRDITGTVRVG